MGAAFVLYAQGLLPFLIPLSVVLFEPDLKSRRRMLPFLAIGAATSLYMLWALIAYPLRIFVQGNSIVYINDGTNNTALAVLYVVATCGSLFFFQGARYGSLRRNEPGDPAGGDGRQAVRVHFAVVRVCGGC